MRIDSIATGTGTAPKAIMSQLLASPVAGPAAHHLTTAQILEQTRATRPGISAAPAGIALQQFTELAERHLSLTPLELHRATTIFTRQIKQALRQPARLRSLPALVTDPNRIATADGRSALELCGHTWHQIRSQAADRADAAIEGAEQFGEGTVLQLAVLRTTQCHVPWWGTPQWETRIDAWSRSIRFASALKRSARDSPELLTDDVLHDIISG